MDWIGLALTFGIKIFEEIDEVRRAKLKKLQLELKSELSKNYHERDDDVIMNLRDQVYVLLKHAEKELKKKS